MNCAVGAARQTEDFTPEPGFGPYCVKCGGPVATDKDGYVQSKTGICRECNNRGSTNKGNRTNHSKAYWGYRGKTTRIIEYQKAKREAG